MTTIVMLPGQGSQFVGMGRFLYGRDATVSQVLDGFFQAWGEGADRLVRAWNGGSRAELASGEVAQPLLFAVDLAVAEVLVHRAEDEVVLVGHSVGELAAATVAGVFDLDLAVAMLRQRAALLNEAPRGGMLACRGRAADVEALLAAEASRGVVGAVNAADQCVVSAGEDDLPSVLSMLRTAGVACMRVASTEPFHSPLLRPQADLLGEHLNALAGDPTRLRPPRIRLVSASTGSDVSAAEALSPSFWTSQMAARLDFQAALETVNASEGSLFVEAGPGQTLALAAAAPARACGADVVTTLPGRAAGLIEWNSALNRLGRQQRGVLV